MHRLRSLARVVFGVLLMTAIASSQIVTRGKEIGSIKHLHKFWVLKFGIKPWAARPGWTSLVHATAVGNNDVFGARIPGVFFKPGTTILHICGPFTFPYTAGCIDLPQERLQLHEWRTLIIRQIPGFTENRFEISFVPIVVGLGKDAAGRTSQPVPERLVVSRRFTNYMSTFHNVTVYEANPWQPPAFYEIGDYKFDSGMVEFNRFEEIPELYPLWKLRLNVFVYGDTKSTTTNLINVGYNRLSINFLPNSYTLQVCIWAPTMLCFTKNLQRNKFSLIEVVHYPTAALNGRRYVVKVDEMVIKEHDYQSTVGVKDTVLVFASNPDKVPDAIIENYELETGLHKGLLLQTIPCLNKQWRFQIVVRPTGTYKPYYTNILHAGLGEDLNHYGGRIPLISFRPDSTRLHVCSSVNGINSFCYDGNTDLSLNTDYTIVVEQILLNGKYLFRVHINGNVVFSAQNNDVREFKNLKVYTSHPWSEPARAQLKGYQFTNL